MNNPPFSILFLLLTFGLVARCTRFLVDDSLTSGLRFKIFQASEPGGEFKVTESDPLTKRATLQVWVENPKTWKHRVAGFIHKLFDCSWCMSVWVAAEVASVASYCINRGGGYLTAYWWVAAAATASLLTGVLTTWLYSKDD
ncbi:MAG: DUF1360 domain-containing protein [Candidatus Methylomirabilales bacterium]